MNAKVKNLLFVALTSSPLWLTLALALPSLSPHENPIIWLFVFVILQVLVLIIGYSILKFTPFGKSSSKWLKFSFAVPLAAILVFIVGIPWIGRALRHFQQVSKIEIPGYETVCVLEGATLLQNLRASATAQGSIVYSPQTGTFNQVDLKTCQLRPLKKLETQNTQRSLVSLANNEILFLLDRQGGDSYWLNLKDPSQWNHIRRPIQAPPTFRIENQDHQNEPLISDEGEEVLWNPFGQAVHYIQNLRTGEVVTFEMPNIPFRTYRIISFKHNQVILQDRNYVSIYDRAGHLLSPPLPALNIIWELTTPYLKSEEGKNLQMVLWETDLGERTKDGRETAHYDANLSGQLQRFKVEQPVSGLDVDWKNKRILVDSHTLEGPTFLIFDGVTGEELVNLKISRSNPQKFSMWQEDYLAISDFYKTTILKLKK